MIRPKIDWYNILGIKRKSVDNDDIKEDNSNNLDIIEIKEMYKKEPKRVFDQSMYNLKSKFNALKNKVPLIINEKNFSLKSILSKIIYMQHSSQRNIKDNNIIHNLEINADFDIKLIDDSEAISNEVEEFYIKQK